MGIFSKIMIWQKAPFEKLVNAIRLVLFCCVPFMSLHKYFFLLKPFFSNLGSSELQLNLNLVYKNLLSSFSSLDFKRVSIYIVLRIPISFKSTSYFLVVNGNTLSAQSWVPVKYIGKWTPQTEVLLLVVSAKLSSKVNEFGLFPRDCFPLSVTLTRWYSTSRSMLLSTGLSPTRHPQLCYLLCSQELQDTGQNQQDTGFCLGSPYI